MRYVSAAVKRLSEKGLSEIGGNWRQLEATGGDWKQLEAIRNNKNRRKLKQGKERKGVVYYTCYSIYNKQINEKIKYIAEDWLYIPKIFQ